MIPVRNGLVPSLQARLSDARLSVRIDIGERLAGPIDAARQLEIRHR